MIPTNARRAPSARYSGRVGAVAVALGIGAAIAGNSATAVADTGPGVDAPHQESSDRHSPKERMGVLRRTAIVHGVRHQRQDRDAAPSATSSSADGPARGAVARAARGADSPVLSAARDLVDRIVKPSGAKTISRSVSRTVAAKQPVLPAMVRRAPSTDGAPLRDAALAGVLELVRRREPDDTNIVRPAVAATTSTVNPLATQDQLAAEELATRIVDTPIIKGAKVVLKVAWVATAYRDFARVGGPDRQNLAQLDQAVDEYALQSALELQLLNPNDPKVIQQVMPPHTWYGQSFGGARILYDNPDTIYRMIPVNNASTYVIKGQFDTTNMPADTTFSVLTGLTGTTTEVLTVDDVDTNSDGTFQIIADSSPTEPGQRNHLQLPEGATLVAARNTLGDWNTEQPMSLTVDRVGGPPDNLFSQLGFYDIPAIGPLLAGNTVIAPLVAAVPPLSRPPLALQAAETAIVMALGIVMEPQYMAVATTDPATGALRPPNQLSEPAHNASFLATQLQSAGYFQLADDEALVIRIDPGNAGYFSVPVTNDWTVTNNYWDQQTSLNDSQAVRNDDGTYTIVVSPTDPGVANWVSTGGLHQGTLSIRFQDLDPASPAAPAVDARVVKVSALTDEYPELASQQDYDRAAQIAARQTGYARRYG